MSNWRVTAWWPGLRSMPHGADRGRGHQALIGPTRAGKASAAAAMGEVPTIPAAAGWSRGLDLGLTRASEWSDRRRVQEAAARMLLQANVTCSCGCESDPVVFGHTCEPMGQV